MSSEEFFFVLKKGVDVFAEIKERAANTILQMGKVLFLDLRRTRQSINVNQQKVGKERTAVAQPFQEVVDLV